MPRERTLTPDEARRFYDRLGRRQDAQAFYEDAAVHRLEEHAALDSARAVFELGHGTGRLAERLLAERLPPDCTYTAVDVSRTMHDLAAARLARFAARAHLHLTGGSPRLPFADRSCDRFLSTYVLDILSAEEISTVLAEAHRMLTDDGRLCLVSLTDGATLPARAVTRAWRALHALRPSLVGGCRPIRLRDHLPAGAWTLLHHSTLTNFALTSEVLVAAPRR